MNDLISVIVPVYNMEKYLDRCIESIVRQSYSNLEIILVDDGSIDNSPLLCDEWAQRDSRITVIHQENSGVAVARNVGLSASSGAYLAFVDSDDWLELDTYEYLYKLIKSGDYQISCCKFEPVKSTDDIIVDEAEQLKCYDYVDIVRNMGPDSLWAIWNKLISRSMFTGIPEDLPVLTFGEDQLLLSFVYKNVNKMILSNQKKYHYFQNDESASRIKLNSKRVCDVLTSYEIMKDYFDASSPAYIYFMTNYMTFNIGYINRIICADCCWEFYDTIRERITANRKMVFSRTLKPKHKISVILLCCFPRLYKFLYTHLFKG